MEKIRVVYKKAKILYYLQMVTIYSKIHQDFYMYLKCGESGNNTHLFLNGIYPVQLQSDCCQDERPTIELRPTLWLKRSTAEGAAQDLYNLIQGVRDVVHNAHQILFSPTSSMRSRGLARQELALVFKLLICFPSHSVLPPPHQTTAFKKIARQP